MAGAQSISEGDKILAEYIVEQLEPRLTVIETRLTALEESQTSILEILQSNQEAIKKLQQQQNQVLSKFAEFLKAAA